MFTLKQAAAKLGVSPVTVRRYIKSGKLAARLVGGAYRVPEDAIDALLATVPPPEVDALIEHALETNAEFRFEHQRSDAFRRAETILRERGNAERAGEIANDALIFGFRLTVHAADERNKTSNRGRFSPRMTGTDSNGQPAAWPDPAWITADVVAHAKRRAAAVRNPVTKAIYCDLVYEFSRNADKPLFGQQAVDAYLLAADAEPEDDASFRYFNTQRHILRAIELALALKDDALFRRASSVALHKMEAFAAAGNVRFLHEISEVLLEQAKKLDETDIARIAALIGSAAQQFFAEGNEHLGRGFVKLKYLLPVVKSDTTLRKQVQRELFDSYVREAEAKSASGLVAAHFYSKALRLAGGVTSPEESAALRRKIEDANLRSGEDMQAHSFGFSITDEEVAKYVNAVLVDTVEESLVRMALLPGMIPSYARAEELAHDLFAKYPFSHLIGRSLIQDGRAVSYTSGGFEVTEDHIVSRLSVDVQMHGIWLGFLFDELQRRGLAAAALAAYLSEKPFFTPPAMPAITEALADYFDGRYYSTIAVLLTQLESLLRAVNRKLGLPTLRSLDSGEQRVIYLSEALDNLKAAFDAVSPDIYHYFSLILLDKRGPGLRDTTAHGLLEFGEANRYQANLLLHLLLILATFEYRPPTVKCQQV